MAEVGEGAACGGHGDEALDFFDESGAALVQHGEGNGVQSKPRRGPAKLFLRAGRAATALCVAGLFVVWGRPLSLVIGSRDSGDRAAALYDTAGTSLFCWCVVRDGSFEEDILRAQYTGGLGIFMCEGKAVFSTNALSLGPAFQTIALGATPSKMGGTGAFATRSWVNTENFIHAWESLRGSGQALGFDWTVKVDPDTVLLPFALKANLVAHGLNGPVNLYLPNCPDVEKGFFGSVEAISKKGLAALFANLDRCRDTLPYHQGWGEDLFLQKCMDGSGVGNQADYDLVADSTCPKRSSDCRPGAAAAFHPFKSLDTWMGCWRAAAPPGLATTTPPPPPPPAAPPANGGSQGAGEQGGWASHGWVRPPQVYAQAPAALQVNAQAQLFPEAPEIQPAYVQTPQLRSFPRPVAAAPEGSWLGGVTMPTFHRL